MSGFDINKVMELLPHGYPFLLIDKVIDTDNKEYLTAIKNVSFNEPFFQGHFPNYPVMPGVFILEAMAQTAACLVAFADKSLSTNSLVFFTGIEKAKFRKPVTPGSTLILKVNILAQKKTLYKFSAEAFVDDFVMASSDFSAMLVDQEKAL